MPKGGWKHFKRRYAELYQDVFDRFFASPAILAALSGEQGGAAVIKPIDGHGGEGVFKLSASDPNKNAIIEALNGRWLRALVRALRRA